MQLITGVAALPPTHHPGAFTFTFRTLSGRFYPKRLITVLLRHQDTQVVDAGKRLITGLDDCHTWSRGFNANRSEISLSVGGDDWFNL
jgi:hypothetical protein